MGDSIASQTAQAAGMSAMSNVLAQCISAYQTQVIYFSRCIGNL